MSLIESPETWNSESLENLLVHVIGGDWGKVPDHQEQGYQTVACIRGSEFRHWSKESGRTAVPRKIKANSLEKRSLIPGDILLEISGGGPDQPVGRTVLINQAVIDQFETPVIGTNFLRLLRPSADMDKSFLNRYLEFFYSSGEVIRYQGGSNNLRNLKFKDYSQISVPVPPVAEQKVIADKLDTLLVQVETTQTRLERIPQILKRFRQSVLAAAVSGKLTEDGELGDRDWPLTKLSNLCNTAFDGPFGSKLKSSDYTENGVGVVRLENIKHLRFDHSKKTFISEEKYLTLEKNKLQKNDLLFSSFVDEEIRACLFPFETLRFINKADCFCLRIDQEKALPEYVLYLLTSQYSYAQIKEHVQGVTRPRVNLKILKSLEFPIPPVQAQSKIVRRVEQLFAHANRIEQQVNNALARVNNLTQSILAKAFRGELTEQWRKDNPELISGENSAEALLERIQAERAAVAGKKKPRKVVRKAADGA